MIAFEVKDMTCGHCVSTLTKALKAVDQAANVQIDLATHRVQVEPSFVNAEELAQAIKDAGYSPTPIAPNNVTTDKRGGGCCGCGGR